MKRFDNRECLISPFSKTEFVDKNEIAVVKSKHVRIKLRKHWTGSSAETVVNTCSFFYSENCIY